MDFTDTFVRKMSYQCFKKTTTTTPEADGQLVSKCLSDMKKGCLNSNCIRTVVLTVKECQQLTVKGLKNVLRILRFTEIFI